MKRLKVPTYAIKLKSNGNEKFVFDPIRKKYIQFTPEEFVRQNIVAHLIETLKVPKSLISIEKAIKIHGLTKRYDIAVYSSAGEPLLLVECKAPSIKIDQNVLDQITTYSNPFKKIYLLLSNGPDTYCGLKIYSEFIWLDHLPDFNGLKS